MRRTRGAFGLFSAGRKASARCQNLITVHMYWGMLMVRDRTARIRHNSSLADEVAAEPGLGWAA
ncbi:MAG TPA: hypothetical protein VGW38_21050 [Chloroflexota bacterium]|nr:hypothetical protein [Chloroflexota bacterium]